ncbi:DNA polymerase III subunit gamma/tau [Candidatus Parcubacteria bacterium]|nr:MAG: DNA polymerase III subunit gamma/tau [Candidatus Parcubacteria bacterium]
MTLAYYRKYRPRSFRELLGQEETARILQNAAKKGELAHAYLFYGPHGTGKTTTARLLAKLFNCERRRSDAAFLQKGEPCNECTTCAEIDKGTFGDLVEIDAASNRGIDEIRNLKEGVHIAPSRGTHRVYIIDEAHMLTKDAFNALLKTLEEPPTHAVFILATTEYEKLPATIVSRTQRFLFRKIPKRIIAEKLRHIAQEEGISFDQDALDLLAASAEGSMRNAESLFHQLAASYKASYKQRSSSLSSSDLQAITGRTSLEKLHLLAAYLLERDTAKSLAALEEFKREGADITRLTKDLIHYLRRVLALSVNHNLKNLFADEFTEEELDRLLSLTRIAPPEKQAAILRALIRAYSEIRYSPLAAAPLEVAIVEILSRL